MKKSEVLEKMGTYQGYPQIYKKVKKALLLASTPFDFLRSLDSFCYGREDFEAEVIDYCIELFLAQVLKDMRWEDEE